MSEKIIASRDIIVVETAIDNDVIQQLKSAYDTNPDLATIIDSMNESLLEEGIEVFDRGNDFIVCEKGIYIACYSDEFDEKFEK